MRIIIERELFVASVIMMTSSNGSIFLVTGPLCGEFTGHRWIPAQRPVTRSFDVFFDLRLNKGLNKQSWGWWFETPLGSLSRHCNDYRLLPFTLIFTLIWKFVFVKIRSLEIQLYVNMEYNLLWEMITNGTSPVHSSLFHLGWLLKVWLVTEIT